jgi:hypothetical protein
MDQSSFAGDPPPLTAEAADSALELIDIMAAVVRGVDLIDVTPQVRYEWRAFLGECYPDLQPPTRWWFANAPMMLQAVREGWQTWPPVVREQIRQSWAAALPGILSFVSPVVPTGQPGYGYAGSAPFHSPAYASPAPSFNDGESVADISARILQQQRQAEEEARGRSDDEYRQIKLYHGSLNAQTLTNMAKMRFDSMMAIANNLRS